MFLADVFSKRFEHTLTERHCHVTFFERAKESNQRKPFPKSKRSDGFHAQAVDFIRAGGFKLDEIETHAIASTAHRPDFGMREFRLFQGPVENSSRGR